MAYSLKFIARQCIVLSMKTVSDTIGCIDSAARIIGDKWTPQLLRAFCNHESVRFCQLQNAVGGINPRTLSARLHELEDQKIIEKVPTSSDVRCEYRLTKKGKDLMPILRSMQNWSQKYSLPTAIA